MGKYRKYVIAALTPLLVWGTHALTAWSVTRGSLVTLIWAEAAAFGVYAVPNDVAGEAGSIVASIVSRVRDLLSPVLGRPAPVSTPQMALPVDQPSQVEPDSSEPTALP